MGYAKNKQQTGRDSKRQGREDASKRKLQFGDYFFVNITINRNERDELQAAMEEGSFIAPSMDEYLGSGYTIKYSKDTRGNGVVCTLTCTDVESGDAGAQLSGRGRDSATAYFVATYKDRVICGTRSWLETQHERGGNNDDIG